MAAQEDMQRQRAQELIERLPNWAKDITSGQQIRAALTGGSMGTFLKYPRCLIATESHIILLCSGLTNASNLKVPYAQFIHAKYYENKTVGVSPFKVFTQSGEMKLSVAKQHQEAMAMLSVLQEKISSIAGVPISISHDKGLLSETWTFYAPPQFSTMQGKPLEQESQSAALLVAQSPTEELVRPARVKREPHSIACSSCGKKQIPGNALFCPDCGNRVEVMKSVRFCSMCGAQMPERDRFCRECGAKLADSDSAI